MVKRYNEKKILKLAKSFLYVHGDIFQILLLAKKIMVILSATLRNTDVLNVSNFYRNLISKLIKAFVCVHVAIYHILA